MPDFKRPYFETKSDKKAFPVTLPEDILENELIESNSHQLGNIDNFGNEAVVSH